MDDMTLLDLAFALAREAGETILRIRARGFDTHKKADQSPVTEADHAAEALILARLRATTPGIPVVAEEEIAAGHVPADARVYWVVDPLDGTREFAAGRDDFAVCIGLVRDGRPALGAVGAPAQGEVFGGIVGVGAWKRGKAGQVAISARHPPAEGIDVVASHHYANDPRLGPFLAGRKVASILNIGSALKFCRVAEGIADLYPRFGRTMEWDTAAPQAVVEAAGGSVLVLETMQPLGYGKPGWENPSFVCAGRA
ncbi:3'(2'),5'-bisphosphate nucleotidase CysQ [Limobrevibacterium gyesilva]|uniref:3'(2'),5'-bisphosphate nucleotidase CysQ n=1 Tax=Limobrevibacterium gyesilva TaxID=2991712 RepID=A0AA41YHX2_9PROT|nr:3'(2'),5'-bisphosphate nucleotidase CysQ [Limobrevibacterium gyesilva]MCW3473154.1 3'(2'),5'-bisphosphate nucleotidase CysQ [Limobrevibacterium gyesilva]